MMGLPAGTRVWLAAGFTDMRSGFNGLAAKVQTALAEDPYSGTAGTGAGPGQNEDRPAVDLCPG